MNNAKPPPKVDSRAASAEGGCACGALRYRLQGQPLFVHCCHCTRCQRETGGPFAHHAVVEASCMDTLAGTPQFVRVPTDSGRRHWVARCPACQTAVWNEHGSRKALVRYLRVGTLDEPDRLPPRAHIYVRSKQAWLALPEGPGQVPSFSAYYDTQKTWPAESLARYEQARAARQQEKATK